MSKQSEDWKKLSTGGRVFAIVIGLTPIFLLGMCVRSCNNYEPTEIKREVMSSGYDGSVWQVESYLKKNLKDPDSYEGIDWSPLSKDTVSSRYMIRHKYRAKNSFGGFNIENQVFVLDTVGNVLSVVNY